MRELRWWLLLLLFWFFCLFNVERLHAPINLASFVYVLTAGVALGVVAVPSLRQIHVGWVLFVPLPFFLALKHWLGYQILGSHIPLTVTEITAITVTILIARRLANGLGEFREAVESPVVQHLNDSSRPFAVGQYDIYREIRRARAHHRPLSMMAISPNGGTVEVARNRLIEQIQRESVDRYVRAQVANLLAGETRESDLIAERDGYFVTLLPETTSDEAHRFSVRLKQVARDHLGLGLRIGLASFPDQEVTFAQLLARASDEMQNGTEKLAVQTTEATERPRPNGSDRRRRIHGPNGGARRPNGRGSSTAQAAAAAASPADSVTS